MAHFQPISGFDPIPYWKKVSAPKFFAFGGNDPNVPVEDSVDILGVNAIEGLIKVYPDGGHGITSSESGAVQSEFFGDLVEFIRTSTDDLLVEPGAGGTDDP
jgi:hypothetical protein